MDVKNQIEIDSRVMTLGEGIVPVELHGAIPSLRVSGGLEAASPRGSTRHDTASFTPMNNLGGIHI